MPRLLAGATHWRHSPLRCCSHAHPTTPGAVGTHQFRGGRGDTPLRLHVGRCPFDQRLWGHTISLDGGRAEGTHRFDHDPIWRLHYGCENCCFSETTHDRCAPHAGATRWGHPLAAFAFAVLQPLASLEANGPGWPWGHTMSIASLVGRGDTPLRPRSGMVVAFRMRELLFFRNDK
jgi:hypothetical protein